MDFGLDIVDGVGRLHLEGDSLAREGLDEAVRIMSVVKLMPIELLRRHVHLHLVSAAYGCLPSSTKERMFEQVDFAE